MASAIVRSGLRTVLRSTNSGSRAALQKRSFSSHASPLEEAQEASKWQKITYVGIVACFALGAYNLSKGHHHSEKPPEYPYLHIRNKEFPWGPDGLFEVKHDH